MWIEFGDCRMFAFFFFFFLAKWIWVSRFLIFEVFEFFGFDWTHFKIGKMCIMLRSNAEIQKSAWYESRFYIPAVNERIKATWKFKIKSKLQCSAFPNQRNFIWILEMECLAFGRMHWLENVNGLKALNQIFNRFHSEF